MITEKELINRIEEKNLKFLGLIDISEEEYKELLAYSRMFVRNVSPTYGVKCDIKVAVTLVQVAIREYKEGRFWSYFCDAIGENVSQSKMNYCGQVFAKTLKRYDLLYINYGDTQMYVENIKMHAIVTNYYMQGMWDFLFSYYEKNLFRQLSDDIEEDLEFLATFMRQTLESNADSFVSEESKGRASKTYRLLKATRYLIASNDSCTNREILLPLLKIIDDYYYDGVFPCDDDRFGQAFLRWCHNKEGEVKNRETSRNRSLISRRPNICFDFNSMSAYLHIPPQKFRDAEFDGEAVIRVSINGYVEKFNLEIYKSFGVYISEEKKIPIPSLFDEIEITVESSVAKKYKLNNSNYRLMNRNYEMVSKLSLGDNLILVEKGTRVSFEGDTKCIDFSEEYRGFDFYSIAASEDSVLHFGNRVISLAGEYSEQPYFEEEILDFEVYDAENSRLIVTRTHPIVSFVVSEKKYAGTVVIVNGRKISVIEINNKVVSKNTNNNNLAITIDMENEIGDIDGTYELIVDIPDERDKKIPKYVRLGGLKVHCDKSIYCAKDSVYVWVKNGGEFIWPEREDVDMVGMQAKGEEYLVPIYGDEEEVVFNLELNEKLKLHLPLCLFRAGFALDDLSFKQPEYIWYSDLKESLYCNAPGIEEIRVYLNHEKDNFVNGFKMKEGLFRVDVADMKERVINNSSEGWQYINVVCIGEKKRSFCLFSLMRFLWINPYFDFKLIDNQLAFDLDVKGNADLFVEIADAYTREVVVQRRRINSGVTIFSELSSEGSYSVFPEMEEGDFFGINVTTTKLRPLLNQSFVTYDDLRDYRLPIGDLIIEGERRPLSYDYFIDLRERKDEGTYFGYMYGLKKAQRQRGVGNQPGKYELNQDGKPIKKRFGKMMVQVLENDEKAITIQVLTSSYDEADEEWVELYYDNVSKTLLHPNDNAISKGTDYTRFDFLDAESTSYRVMKKKIRRLKTDAI